MSNYRSVRAGRLLGVFLIIFALSLLAVNGLNKLGEDRAARDAQRALASSLSLQDAGVNEAPPDAGGSASYEIPRYREGEAVGQIESEDGYINSVFVMGTTVESLSRGPGVFFKGALPGLAGNTAIAGHRTSHGAPFRYIDKLSVGSALAITTSYGKFKYIVTGSSVVSPKDVRVLSDKTGADLTLIACHPLHSTKQRIVVTATAVEEQ